MNPRLSQRLQLEYPYDWSNSRMGDDALILAVLMRSRFNDVLAICLHYGRGRVQAVADTLTDLDALTQRRLRRTLGIIAKAESRVPDRTGA